MKIERVKYTEKSRLREIAYIVHIAIDLLRLG